MCRAASTWTLVDRTETDPMYYVEAELILPAYTSQVSFESISASTYGIMNITASPLYRGENVIISARAGHTDLAVLQRIAICKRALSNSTVYTSLEVCGSHAQGTTSSPLHSHRGLH
jgi:hypothetical protein